MFTPHARAALADDLVEAARRDPDVTAVARVGSAARDAEDPWSDIDLALRLAPGATPEETATRWTERLRDGDQLVDHLDVRAGLALYRVFLLRSTLQVDLSFWPAGSFRATGPAFRLLHGTTDGPALVDRVEPAGLVGMAWLHALHARSAIVRGRSWQAVEMLAGLRDQVVALACTASGLPAHQGRGVDALPPTVLGRLEPTLVRSLDAEELTRAFSVLVDLLLTWLPTRDDQLAAVLRELVTSTRTHAGHR